MTMVSEIPKGNRNDVVDGTLVRLPPYYRQRGEVNNVVCINAMPYCCNEIMQRSEVMFWCGVCGVMVLKVVSPVAKDN